MAYMAITTSAERSRPCMFFRRMSVSIVLTITTGATSVVSELNTMAATAPMKGTFSVAKSGRNFLPDSRSDRFCGRAAFSSVYFIVARAALGIVELDIFGRRLHQLAVRADGQEFTFHQENDLVVIDH